TPSPSAAVLWPSFLLARSASDAMRSRSLLSQSFLSSNAVTIDQSGLPTSLVDFSTAATPLHSTHPQRSTRVARHCPVMVFSRHAGRRSAGREYLHRTPRTPRG